MLTELKLKLPASLVNQAQKYADDKGTTLTAIIRQHLVDVASIPHDSLLEFSRGAITKEQAIEAMGLRDYAQLLVALGESDIPLPVLPHEQIERQVETLSRLWSSP